MYFKEKHRNFISCQ